MVRAANGDLKEEDIILEERNKKGAELSIGTKYVYELFK